MGSADGTPSLRTRRLQTSAEKLQDYPESIMRLPKRWVAHRCVLVLCVGLGLLALVFVSLPLTGTRTIKSPDWHVDPVHKKRVHRYVRGLLEGQCLPGSSRRKLLSRLPDTSQETQPFLWKDSTLSEELFQYPPPFGLRGYRSRVEELLKLLPDSASAVQPGNSSDKCKRCVVVGNGGILRDLELGSLIDRFDVVIRLNSGPLGEFSVDVGNRTSIRMSYPEGTPLQWVDSDPQTLFVAVLYKGVDLSWTSAMISGLSVPLWDWLFFWQKVPGQIPLESSRFRLLNPGVIRETALHLLKYQEPRARLWGSDQNVPTIGVSALSLASLLCDQVSLAGFGYHLSQQGAPLHYYDHLPVSFMLGQTMHNVDRETELLQSLVKEGTITDLSGGIHCSFCPS